MKREEAFVGQRIVFSGNCAIGLCSGVIQKIYEPRSKEDFPGAARVKVDSTPSKWPYGPDGVFAPWFPELTPEAS